MVSFQQMSGTMGDTSLNNIVVILIAVILFLLVLYYKIVNRRKTSLAKRIPGSDGTFFMGLVPVLLGGAEKILTNVLKLCRKYENTLIKFWILNGLYIFLNNPEDIEVALNNPDLFNKAKHYKAINETVGCNGIFSNRNFQEWKKNRKLVTAGLKYSMLKMFVPIFYEEAKFLGDIMYEKREINSNECEISCAIGNVTMEIIGRTALGVKFNAQKNAKHPFVENTHIIQNIWTYRVTHPWLMNNSLFRLSAFKRKQDIIKSEMYNFIEDIGKKIITELKKNINSQGEHNKECIGLKSKSLIGILLENGNQMTFKQIQDEIMTVVVAGQDTTSLTNACTIFMLAHHQDVQNKVLEELLTIFSSGDPDRPPTYEDLQKMVYLERVIKETLRLYTVVPVYARSVEKETMIGGYLIPAGSTLVVFTHLLHLNAEFYPEPKMFNPDNFLPEACRSRHPYSFLPFSAGYRNCPGIKYAMLQIKTIISTLVRSYRFSPSDKCPKPENLRLTIGMTQKFVNGCYVKIEART